MSIYVSDAFTDYCVLDTGDGRKLEKWGKYYLSRPDPQVLWSKQDPKLWGKADAVYIRSKDGGGHWEFYRKLPERWVIRYKNLSFYVHLTGFKHTGLFPEQASNWDYMSEKIRNAGFMPKILNLFAYTGAATLACAAAGASVTHVDAAKSMNVWAKENLSLSGLENRPVRFLTDDCLKFVLREQRRGNKYDGIVMDPPSYGRGAKGAVFRTQDNLYELVKQTAELLSDDALFFIINSYTTGLSYLVSRNMLSLCLPDGRIEGGDLALPVQLQNVLLPCGTTARWERK